MALARGGFIGFAPHRRAISTEPEAVEREPKPLQPRSPQVIAKAAAMPAKAGTKVYYLQRLEREHPALAAKIASGEMSVYASIAAGLRKAPTMKWTKADTYAYTQKVDA